MVIEGILCQALLPRADGRGRAMVMEVLVPTPAIRNLIREDKIHQIYSAMQTGTGQTGMQTFNQSLAQTYLAKQITLDMALARLIEPGRVAGHDADAAPCCPWGDGAAPTQPPSASAARNAIRSHEERRRCDRRWHGAGPARRSRRAAADGVGGARPSASAGPPGGRARGAAPVTGDARPVRRCAWRPRPWCRDGSAP